MEYRRLMAIWALATMIVLVAIIGCGGSGSSSTEAYLAARFVGTWNGTMVGNDGSNTTVALTISNAGAVTWSTVTNDPYSGWAVTETGTIQSSGDFLVTGSTPATAGVTISGALNQSGTSLDGTATGCCPNDFLYGGGTVSNGLTKVQVTLKLSGFGE